MDDSRESFSQSPVAEGVLTTCNCRWDGDKVVQQCTLHEAWELTIHEWAERAKEAEAKLAQSPAGEAPARAVVGAVAQTRGYHALVNAIEHLQQTGEFVDEEGDDTDALVTLMHALAAQPPAAGADARPRSEWHEDNGDVVWWRFEPGESEPVGEPAWIGTPNDHAWNYIGGGQTYYTHWTPHPKVPALASLSVVKEAK